MTPRPSATITWQGLAAAQPLTDLRLRGCPAVTGEGLAALAELPCLEQLILGASQSGARMEALSILPGLPRLLGLEIDGCPELVDDGLAGLGAMSKLGILRLSRLDIDGACLASLPEGAIKTSLYVRSCPRFAAEALRHLEGRELFSLSLIDCPGLAAGGLRHLPEMPRLRELKLRVGDELSAEDLALLGRLPALERLDLSGCENFRGGGLEALVDHPGLTWLDLDRTAVTDESLAHLRGLPSLTELHLSDCPNVTEGALEHLATIPNLYNPEFERLREDPAPRWPGQLDSHLDPYGGEPL